MGGCTIANLASFDGSFAAIGLASVISESSLTQQWFGRLTQYEAAPYIIVGTEHPGVVEKLTAELAENGIPVEARPININEGGLTLRLTALDASREWKRAR